MLSTASDDFLPFPGGVNTTGSGEIKADTYPQQYRLSGGPFLHPLLVTVEEIEDDQFLAADELLSSYGVGNSVDEAIDDLITMLSEYHAELVESRHHLSRHLRQQLRLLTHFLGPRS